METKIIFKAYELYEHSIDEDNRRTNSYLMAKQPDGEFGYFNTNQLALTSSNTFTGTQTIIGNINIDGDISANAFNVTTYSISHFSASTNFGLDADDTHTFTGSVSITGSLNVIGGINGVINATNGVVSSSAQITSFGFVSGSYETTGRSIISSSAQITTLGFISSSQTLDTASLATTGSNLFRGDQTITGSLFVSGATEFGGNLVPKTARGATLGTSERPFSEIYVSSGSINIASDIIGDPNTTLTNLGGNILVSAGGMRLIGDASFIAATGSFQYISGSMTQVGDYTQFGNYIMIGNKTISGSLNISGSGFINNRRILTDLDSGSYAITGSNTFSGSQGISGSLYVSESLYVTNEIYLNGNKLFNYGQFSDTTTQSGSANTAYSMKLNTTDIAHNISVVSGTRLTVANTGIYNLQFSAQLDNTSNTNEIVDIWVAITGSNVANSNTQVAINKAQAGNSGKLVAAWNYLLPLSASNYVELKWSSNGGGIILSASDSASNPTRPGIPSVIVTMTQIA